MGKVKKATKKMLQKSTVPKKGAGKKIRRTPKVVAAADAVEDTPMEAEPVFDFGMESGDELDHVLEESDFDEEMLQHQQEIEELKETDPEFYKYLQSNAQSLLRFDAEAEAEAEPVETSQQEVVDHVEMESQVEVLCKAVETTKSLRAVKKLLAVYKTACRLSEDEEDTLLGDAQAFHTVMHFCLSKLDSVLYTMLQQEPGTAINAKSPQWKKLKRPVQSFLGNTLFFLAQEIHLSSPDVARFTLSRLHAFLPFFVPFPALGEHLLKRLVRVWSSSALATSCDLNLLNDAYTLLRALVLSQPALLQTALKGVYLSYSRIAKAPSTAVAALQSCVVDLYCLDPVSSYPLLYAYLRQLGVLLRNAVVKPSTAHTNTVTGWPFVNALRVITLVVAQQLAQDRAEHTRPLLYPLVQLWTALADTHASPSFAPLRLHCARSLLLLAKNGQVYVPLAPTLVAVLAGLPSKPTPGGPRSIGPLQGLLKVPKSTLNTEKFVTAVVEETVSLLRVLFTLQASSVAFPEMVLGAVKVLSKTGVPALNSKHVRSLVQQLRSNADWIRKHRDSVSFVPADAASVSQFLADVPELPPLAHYMAVQHKSGLGLDHLLLREASAPSAPQPASKSGKKDGKKDGKKTTKNDGKKTAKKTAGKAHTLMEGDDEVEDFVLSE